MADGDEVELTAEEEAAAVKAAVAVKQAELKAAAEAEAEAAARKERTDHPEQFIGVDIGKDGTYSYIKAPKDWAKDRTVRIGLLTYEHVADDADGVWCYRHLG